VRKHLSYANVISTLCLVLVVGGGAAYAANTIRSTDIVNGQVKSVDIGTSEVTATDIADNAVSSAKINDGSVASADVTNNSIRGGDIANNSLDTTDINESTFVLDDHFTAADSVLGGCSDDNHAGAVCATVDFDLERPGKVLMNAAGNWHTTALDDLSGPGSDTDTTSGVLGRCVLRIDGNSITSPTPMGETKLATHSSGFDATFALTDMTDRLFTGLHTVDVFCIEADGDIDWSNIKLTVARVDN
jgi:hypothetical protein